MFQISEAVYRIKNSWVTVIWNKVVAICFCAVQHRQSSHGRFPANTLFVVTFCQFYLLSSLWGGLTASWDLYHHCLEVYLMDSRHETMSYIVTDVTLNSYLGHKVACLICAGQTTLTSIPICPPHPCVDLCVCCCNCVSLRPSINNSAVILQHISLFSINLPLNSKVKTIHSIHSCSEIIPYTLIKFILLTVWLWCCC